MTQITPFTAVPNRGMSQETLVNTTNTFFSEIGGFVGQANQLIGDINTAATNAIFTAPDWVAQAYESHKVVIYTDHNVYMSTEATLSTDVPSVSAKWKKLNVTASTGLNYQVFTSSGTWTVPDGVTNVKVLLLSAGGGGGGGACGYVAAAAYNTMGAAGGGGGGSGFATMEDILLTSHSSGDSITVTVGAGGVGGTAGPVNSTYPNYGTAGSGGAGGTGGSSSFGSYIAIAGGAGGGGGGAMGSYSGSAGYGTAMGGTSGVHPLSAPTFILGNSGGNATIPLSYIDTLVAPLTYERPSDIHYVASGLSGQMLRSPYASCGGGGSYYSVNTTPVATQSNEEISNRVITAIANTTLTSFAGYSFIRSGGNSGRMSCQVYNSSGAAAYPMSFNTAPVAKTVPTYYGSGGHGGDASVSAGAYAGGAGSAGSGGLVIVIW